MTLDAEAKENLIQVAHEEAERLNHLITNLLDESRIEAGAITLSRQPSEIQGLPDIDGVEVTRLLREWTQIPIIILSVRESESDKIAALDAGADDYLTKPFRPDKDRQNPAYLAVSPGLPRKRVTVQPLTSNLFSSTTLCSPI